MKPIVLISTDGTRDPTDARTGGRVFLNWNYAEMVVRAGGVPLLVPPIPETAAEAARLADAWLIPGGDDILPARYGAEPHPACRVGNDARFETEVAIYGALRPDAPVLGICYGLQLLNVLRGGTLVQHLPDVSATDHTDGSPQPVRVRAGTRLAERTGVEILDGPSYHHQAIGDVGEGLRVAAIADDGTIEGIEDPAHRFFIGVQWHPERAPEDPATRALFRAFIATAERN